MNKIRLTLAASLSGALLLTPIESAFPHESDQYTLPIGRDFADLGPYFSRIVYGAVVGAATETNAAIRDAIESNQPEQRIAELQSADFIGGELWQQLFAALPTNELLDIGLVSDKVRAQYPGLVTMYRPSQMIYDDPLLLLDITKPVRAFFRAGTVNADGKLVGTDKIIHFINIGRIYHSKYESRRARGLPDKHATASAIASTARNPFLSEDGVLGMFTTGIHSNGDLAADYAGFKFYRNLTEAVRIGKKMMPPMLVQEGPYWRVQVEPDSDFFTSFITPHWNEALNPNKYIQYVGNRVRVMLRDRCTDAIDWYRDKRGQTRGQAQFEAIEWELATFYGEEYGYSSNGTKRISIATTCFSTDAGAAQPEAEQQAKSVAPDRTPPSKATQVEISSALSPRGTDTFGRSALWWAAKDGRAEAVELLVVQGEEINAPDYDGETPLHAAARSGHAAVVRALLARGANADRDALYGVTPLMLAARGGHADTAAALLRAGANPNAQDLFGRTPLHAAALKSNRQLAELLLDHGADPMAIDAAGNTPLHLAARAGKETIVAVLLNRGAEPRTRNALGATPSDEADRQGRTHLAQLLETDSAARSAAAREDSQGAWIPNLGSRSEHSAAIGEADSAEANSASDSAK